MGNARTHLCIIRTYFSVVFAITLLEIFIGYAFLAVLAYGIQKSDALLVRIHFHAELASVPLLLINAAFSLCAIYSSFNESVVYATRKPTIILALAFISILMALFECYSIPLMRQYAIWFYKQTDLETENKKNCELRKSRLKNLVQKA